MKINELFPLIIRDVNVYDIESCHYNILKNMNYNMEGIDKDNKEERNIAIGKLMRDNPNLTKILRETTKSIIDELIRRNNLKEEDIILRQYDGIMTTKYLRENDLGAIPVDLRKIFEIFIASYKRNMYIAKDGSRKASIKGIPNKYEEMNKIYKRILNLSFHNRVMLFKSLQRLHDHFYTTDNSRLFAIPKRDSYIVYIKRFGPIEVSNATLNIMDADDIDRKVYFQNYIQPFTKSIVIENVR